MSILSDFHIHTRFSGDSKENPESVVKKAVEMGFKRICFTDHQDFDYIWGDLSFDLDYEAYFDYMLGLREKYRDDIKILIGVEVGVEPYLAQRLRDFTAEKPYDFIIGSSHIVNRVDPYYPEYFQGKTDKQAFEEYFNSILDNLNAYDDFDVYGHLDYVVRYSKNKDKYYSYELFAEVIDEILKKLIKMGKGIEVNSAAYRYGLKSPNPLPEIIKRYRELGGEIITVGSDAHKAQDAGADFNRIACVLKQAGFEYYTVFENRKPNFLKID
ncbi:MAG: histidinol-phosphatase HisJ family protein [Ruminococcus sp.]|nr:histidinol-phosphatase HisJ family protein [Ruminococcus sp.]